MTDKAKLAEQQARGANAERLLNDPLFQEFLEKAENQFIEQFKLSELDDDRTRNYARVGLGVLNQIRTIFRECIGSGTLATDRLNELKEEKGQKP